MPQKFTLTLELLYGDSVFSIFKNSPVVDSEEIIVTRLESYPTLTEALIALLELNNYNPIFIAAAGGELNA
jgi:hypothetical protein